MEITMISGRKPMIPKRESILITFHTTTAAMAMEEFCRQQHLPGRLIPVPGMISAGCGLAWCAPPGEEDRLLAAMQQQNIPHQGLHHCLI